MANKPALYAKLLQDVYDGKSVKCPMCGANGLKYRLCADTKSRVGFAQFHCDSCGMEEHLSRMKFNEGVVFEEI